MTISVTSKTLKITGKTRIEDLKLSRESRKTVTPGVTFCPTCHHPISTDDIAHNFAPVRRQVYELIRDAGTDGITRPALEALIYEGTRHGGPDSNSIAVTICQGINPRLKPKGLMIRSRGYRFRLERISHV